VGLLGASEGEEVEGASVGNLLGEVGVAVEGLTEGEVGGRVEGRIEG